MLIAYKPPGLLAPDPRPSRHDEIHSYRSTMKRFLLIVSLLTLTGCRTLEDARSSKGQGRTRTYDAPCATVWKAIPKAANALDLSIAGTYEDEKYYLAERGLTGFSYGEKVAIFVTCETDTRTTVEVVSRQVVLVNLLATDFEGPLLNKIGEMIPAAK